MVQLQGQKTQILFFKITIKTHIFLITFLEISQLLPKIIFVDYHLRNTAYYLVIVYIQSKGLHKHI